MLYTYANSKVDTGFDNLGKDFMDWLQTSKTSNVKQKRISEHIQKNSVGFSALWIIYSQLQAMKDNIINQFDAHDQAVKATIGSSEGGEGYVMQRPWGSMKLVNRQGFTAANRAVQR